MNIGIAFKIFLYIRSRLAAADAKLIGKTEVTDSVNNAEIDSLRVRPLFWGNLFKRNSQDLRCRPPVDILFVAKRPDKTFISWHMRQYTEFHLRIIGRNKAVISRPRDEKRTNLPPFCCTDRNILQIGIRAGQTSCGGNCLIKWCMNPSRFRADKQRQCLKVCGNQFWNRSVFQNIFHKGITFRQHFQHICRCGITVLCLLAGRHAHLFEQNNTKLLRWVHIKFFSRCLVNQRQQFPFPYL